MQAGLRLCCSQTSEKRFSSVEAQISFIPWSKEANIRYRLANSAIINFPKYSIFLEVRKILNQVSHIPGSKSDSVLYHWK